MRIVLQKVLIVQQQQFGGVFAVSLLTTPPQAAMRPTLSCRDAEDGDREDGDREDRDREDGDREDGDREDRDQQC